MKRTTKNLIKGVLFTALAVCLLVKLTGILSWKDTAGNYRSTMNTLYHMEENKVDVLFLGSSHSYCSVNPAKLWTDHGIAGFSLAVSGQDVVSSYHCLIEALKTQKPKVVCMDILGATFHGYLDEGNLYRNVLGYKPSVNYYQTVKDMVEPEMQKEFLAKLPIIHTRYKELQRQDFVQDTPAFLGYYPEFAVGKIGWKDHGLYYYDGGEKAVIEAEEEKWIRSIISLCKENNIELCFIVAPYAASDLEQQQFNYMEELAQQEGVAFLNLIRLKDSLELDAEHDFLDWGHLNYWGATKVTEYLGDYLTTQYTLEDHRGQAGYELWQEDAKAVDHEVESYNLKCEPDLYTYMDHVNSLEDCEIVVSTMGDFQKEGYDFSYLLEEFGIPQEQFAMGGTWKISGENVEYMPHGENYQYHFSFDSTDLAFLGSPQEEVIYVNRDNRARTENGIAVLVYDKVLKRVIDVTQFENGENYIMIR